MRHRDTEAPAWEVEIRKFALAAGCEVSGKRKMTKATERGQVVTACPADLSI